MGSPHWWLQHRLRLVQLQDRLPAKAAILGPFLNWYLGLVSHLATPNHTTGKGRLSVQNIKKLPAAEAPQMKTKVVVNTDFREATWFPETDPGVTLDQTSNYNLTLFHFFHYFAMTLI